MDIIANRPLAIAASHPLLTAALSFLCMACPLQVFAGSGAAPVTSFSGVPTITVAPPGVHGFPFASSALNLAADGFTETEYDFSGTAQAYINTAHLGASGEWHVAPNPGVRAAYTSRLLVRSPSDPRRFNGTVIVEWFNDSAGFDTNTDWEYIHDELLTQGYAWVGVTAQYVGAIALQAWEAGEPGDRYASINHPGDSFSYDIFTQAGRALIEPPAGGPQPLGALTGNIKAVLAVGYSQSGSTMFTYVNAIQPLAKVYNGFIVHSAGVGQPLSISTASFANSSLPAPPGVPPTPDINVPVSSIRTDQPAPILGLDDEFTNIYLYEGVTLHNEPDNAKFRLWEIAGMTHFDPIIAGYPDLLKTYPDTAPPFEGCTIPPPNTGVPGSYAERAAVHALNQWVVLGIVPTSAPRFILREFPVGGYTMIYRDPSTNIALGGIRLPPVAAPIATLTGYRPEGADVTCGPAVGAYDPWDGDTDPWDGQPGLDPSPTPEPVLSTLYPTHADYVNQVSASAAAAVASGFMLPADAAIAIAQAKASSVP
jgi:hypothetical protein